MKLCNRGITGFEHFHIQLRCNGPQVLWGNLVGKRVHDFAPAPEGIASGTYFFTEARHSALKSMAVNIGHTGDRRMIKGPINGVKLACQSIDLQALYQTVISDRDGHTGGPARVEVRLFKPIVFHLNVALYIGAAEGSLVRAAEGFLFRSR